MRSLLRTATAAGLCTLAAACAPRPAPATRPSADVPISGFELLGEFNIPPLHTVDGPTPARFGGISALAIDTRGGELLGLSDDREHSRVFMFRPVAPPAEGGFRVEPHGYHALQGHPDAPAALDPEGLALTRGGRLFVASEGIQNEEPRVPPAIVEYTRTYEFVRQLDVPAKFLPPATGPIDRGVRNNASFESLTLTPDEQRLYTASESPLVQDGPAAGLETGGLIRILEYVAAGETYQPVREFAYPLDPLGPLDFEPGYLVTGLVELLALGDGEFLAMERGFAQEANDGPRSVNRIRIFRASLRGASDISALDSIRGRPVEPARKQLLLDLSTVRGLSPALANLDNFEGMVFGPTLPDGSRTLLIVSDDNFNPRQLTSFLLFRIRP